MGKLGRNLGALQAALEGVQDLVGLPAHGLWQDELNRVLSANLAVELRFFTQPAHGRDGQPKTEISNHDVRGSTGRQASTFLGR